MQLTHFDENGKAIMVDVTEKNDTVREATAKGRILVSKEVYDAIEAGTVGKGTCSEWQQLPELWVQRELPN